MPDTTSGQPPADAADADPFAGMADAPADGYDTGDEDQGDGGPPGMFGFGGRILEGAPDIAPGGPTKPPPDFSHFRQKAAEAAARRAPEGMAAPAMAAPEPPPPEEAMDLRTWLSQWEYALGGGYIQIERRHPVLFKGISTGGHCEDVHEPFDNLWLGSRWGGGTFRVSVFQLDTIGRVARKSFRDVMIQGQPTHYRGVQGEPVPIPGVMLGPSMSAWGPAEGSTVEAWGRPMPAANGYGPYATRSPYAGQPGQPGRSPWPGPEASAPGAALAAASRSEQDVRVMDMMRSTVQGAAAQQVGAYQAQVAAYQEEINRLRLEMDRVRHDGLAAANVAVQPANAAIESSRHAIEQVRQGYEAQLIALRQSFSDERLSTAQQHDRNLGELRQSHERQLSALREEHGRYLNDVRDRHQGELAQWRERIRDVEEGARKDLERQKATLEAQWEARVAMAVAEATRLRDEITRVRDESRRDVDTIRTELTAERTRKAQTLPQQLAEVSGMMRAFGDTAGALGFEKPDPGASAEPTDWFSRTVKALPQINQHLVDPTLKRLERMAAGRANGAPNGRVQVLPALPMAQPTAVAGAAYGMPVATQGGGVAAAQVESYMRAYGPQTVEATAHPAQGQDAQAGAPAPQGQAPAQPADGQVAEEGIPAPVAQLIAHLERRFAEDADPSMVAAEIHASAPAPLFAGLKDMPQAAALAQVQDLAGDAAGVSTPGGHQWLAQVHAALQQL